MAKCLFCSAQAEQQDGVPGGQIEQRFQQGGCLAVSVSPKPGDCHCTRQLHQLLLPSRLCSQLDELQHPNLGSPESLGPPHVVKDIEYPPSQRRACCCVGGR